MQPDCHLLIQIYIVAYAIEEIRNSSHTNWHWKYKNHLGVKKSG